MAISFNSFATTVSSMGAVDRPKDSALNWYVRPWTWNLYHLYWYMEVGVLEIYWGNPLPLLKGRPDGLQKVWFAQT